MKYSTFIRCLFPLILMVIPSAHKSSRIHSGPQVKSRPINETTIRQPHARLPGPGSRPSVPQRDMLAPVSYNGKKPAGWSLPPWPCPECPLHRCVLVSPQLHVLTSIPPEEHHKTGSALYDQGINAAFASYNLSGSWNHVSDGWQSGTSKPLRMFHLWRESGGLASARQCQLLHVQGKRRG